MDDRPRTFLFTVAILTAAAVILFIAGPVTPQAAVDPGVNEGRTITVHGEGYVTVQPDSAVVVLEVSGIGPTAQAAQAETNAATVAVSLAWRQAGIASRQVNVTDMHVGPSGSVFRGVQVLQAEVTDLGRLSEVLDVALASGATAVRSVTYTLKREAELRQQAVDRAIRDARSRAQAAAETSGVTLLGLRTLHVYDPQGEELELPGPGQAVWRATVVATYDIR